MTAVTDLLGEKAFGRWEVQGRDLSRRGKHAYWLCKCSGCGRVKSITGDNLLSGRTTGCKGCSHWKGCGEISKDFFNGIVKGAKVRQLAFDLSIEFLWELYLRQERRCVLSGEPIAFYRNRSKDRENGTASLDRIDSGAPYIETNVQWVHKVVQFMKWKLSQEEFLSWCRRVSENSK